jgi:hypothetical protein
VKMGERVDKKGQKESWEGGQWIVAKEKGQE